MNFTGTLICAAVFTGAAWVLFAGAAYAQTTGTQGERLLPPALDPLPLGAVQPEGWLRNQLRTQADGLSGQLDEFWPSIADSGWIGGASEGWERGPYWLDGIVPLAYLLDDAALKAKVARWLDYILQHQGDDGWLGPEAGRTEAGYTHKRYDPWPNFVMLKVLMQYEQATQDPRVVPAALRLARKMDAVLDENPLTSWAQFRWQDLVLGLHWLYDRTGEAWLLDLAGQAHDQGYDWAGAAADFPFREKTQGEFSMMTHVVNNAMGIKAPGLWYRQSGDEAFRKGAYAFIDALDRYHGQATGLFTGDEHLAGRSPSQGTELCAVVEYMYSLETLVSLLGDPALADRLERIAYNALPATFTADMWAHQYDQQANQVVCKVSEERVYTNNNAEANLFGLEPNFGCCLANFSQGWPKLAAHLWMKTPEDGLAAVVYAPCTVKTTVRNLPLTVTVRTEYPFKDTVDIIVHTDAPVRFPLHLRIPAWAEGATVTVDGVTQDAPAGAFHVISRGWDGDDAVTLRLPMPARGERRFNDSIAISRGPLVYALKIQEEWRRLRGEKPDEYWEVHPKTAWNYALQWNPDDPDSSIAFTERELGPMPFSQEGAPVLATVKGRRLPGWGLERNAAAPPPPSPATSNEPLEVLTLIPYGCARLRVTEFPVLE